MSLYTELSPFVEYIHSIRKLKTYLSFDMLFPSKWSIPKSIVEEGQIVAFEAESHGIKLAELISEIISPVLGWTNKERKASVSAYQSLVEREIDALAEVISQAHKVNS